MNEGTTTRILLVDDHPMMRRGLRDLLELEDDLEMVGEAGNGEDAIRLAQEIEPDLILMDLNMPGIDGLETTRRMRDADIDARIIMFTVSDEQSHVLEALRNGADGYLLKDGDPREILTRLRNERAPLYAQAPIHVVSSSGPHVQTINKVLQGISQWL